MLRGGGRVCSFIAAGGGRVPWTAIGGKPPSIRLLRSVGSGSFLCRCWAGKCHPPSTAGFGGGGGTAGGVLRGLGGFESVTCGSVGWSSRARRGGRDDLEL